MLLFYQAVFGVLVPVRSAMAQERSLSKITDFMTGSSRKEREEGDVDCVPPPPKRSCHCCTFDPKWTDEFPWVVYVPAAREDRPSMLCRLCRKHNDASKRMVWLTIRCKLLRKDNLHDHERSRCQADAVQAEAIASAAKRSGGIAACLETVSLPRQAV